jgi:hypothetical protein
MCLIHNIFFLTCEIIIIEQIIPYAIDINHIWFAMNLGKGHGSSGCDHKPCTGNDSAINTVAAASVHLGHNIEEVREPYVVVVNIDIHLSSRVREGAVVTGAGEGLAGLLVTSEVAEKGEVRVEHEDGVLVQDVISATDPLK